MRVRCGRKDADGNQACCFDSSRKTCSVPWASLEEGVSHPAFNELLRTGEIFETFCFADEWTFVPDHFARLVGYLYTESFKSESGRRPVPKTDDSEAWLKAHPEFKKTYLPDMPVEYFRMPYSQAKSDIIRYGLLFHHGGMYMDTDFLVVKDSHHCNA
eukprot:g11035.t1